VADLFEIIGTRLSTDTDPGGVNEPSNGATAGFHRSRAPEGVGYDRVIVKDVTGLPVRTFAGPIGLRKFVQFMVYTVDPVNGGETGTAKCARLKKRIQDLFEASDEAIGDSSLRGCFLDRELPMDTQTDSSGRDIYSAGCIFAFWTG
jgi:hypothetical protein